jgi:2-amino-4-hydroxy-6-hydroxymethyldihydropteridine diphosphokinase
MKDDFFGYEVIIFLNGMMVYLLLGSNIEPRAEYLNRALLLIQSKIGAIEASSSHYETAAWGKENQPDFLNKAIRVQTHMMPEDLLKALKEIENEVGRIHREIWGMREIDIDILLIDDIVYSSPLLQIPHPRLHERQFALQPLKEIAPSFIHPTLQKTIAEIAYNCCDKKRVWKVD